MPKTPGAPKGRAPEQSLITALHALSHIPNGPRFIRFHRPTQHVLITGPEAKGEHSYPPDQVGAYLAGAHDATQALLSATRNGNLHELTQRPPEQVANLTFHRPTRNFLVKRPEARGEHSYPPDQVGAYLAGLHDATQSLRTPDEAEPLAHQLESAVTALAQARATLNPKEHP